MGALSAKYDDNFVRLILVGDEYVNMTNDNIEKGDFWVPINAANAHTFLIAYNKYISFVFSVKCAGYFLSVGSIGLLSEQMD